MKKLIVSTLITGLLATTPALAADQYAIDTKGAHASVNFKINHLGYSWVVGRFDTFEGTFAVDGDAPKDFQVTIDTASVNSNHAERDKHIRSDDFLDVSEFPEASFTSTGYRATGDGQGVLEGQFTLRGVTKAIEIAVSKVGEGEDPWGGYRIGYEGSTTLKLKDFEVPMDLGPQSAEVQIDLHVEGVKL